MRSFNDEIFRLLLEKIYTFLKPLEAEVIDHIEDNEKDQNECGE